MTLRLTEEDLKRIQERRGQGGRQAGGDQATPRPLAGSQAAIARGSTATGPAGMNNTEARYLNDRILPLVKAGEVLSYEFESVSRRLSVNGERCWYKPDFEVMLKCGQIEYHEVKGGYVREDGQIKFQAAMKQYPMFHWLMWQYRGGEWLLIKDSRKLNRATVFLSGL